MLIFLFSHSSWLKWLHLVNSWACNVARSWDREQQTGEQYTVGIMCLIPVSNWFSSETLLLRGRKRCLPLYHSVWDRIPVVSLWIDLAKIFKNQINQKLILILPLKYISYIWYAQETYSREKLIGSYDIKKTGSQYLFKAFGHSTPLGQKLITCFGSPSTWFCANSLAASK